MRGFKQFFRHSGRLVTVILLLVITYCYAMFQGGFVSWFVFFTILPFLLYSILLAVFPIHFKEISRTLSKDRIERGNNVQVTVRFRNTSWFPIVFMMVQELPMDNGLYERPNGNVTKLFLVGWKREFEWTYELKALKRGEYHFKGLEFTCTDFFGWTIRKVAVNHPQLFLVYPKVSDVNVLPIGMQYDQGSSQSRYSLVKDTTMATGVREYIPGDRFSWIHWKSFAKNGELRTKEFEDRKSQNMFILIDRAVHKNFEQVIDYTASYINKIVKGNGDVSFLSAGDDRYFAPIIKTDKQFEKVLQHLVTVQPDAQFGIERLLYEEQKFMSRSVVVIVTGELVPELREILNSGTKYARKIICFVVNDEKDSVQLFSQNNEVHYVGSDELQSIYSEVKHA
ncbi:DUF58 domain-containing protein [Solibacillus sp. A46]|uniref:DUF58 domain-containing protein n=1 Tax=Solibacillus faecavium TaxID=2762221 RepID=A0ABR8Y3G2_9BACL|nr:DUF58 domain-containing protein [Solibacillus faecavium]MBD8038744.1 DUF58 domain-containing protein [Solibacillus faecavium]